MLKYKVDKQLEKLNEFDTPTITNVVATYPDDMELCLGLYDPWTINWYTDQSLKCLYPELGSRVGYAVTVTYGMPDPEFTRLSMADIFRAVDAMPKPVVVCLKQDLPEEIKNKNGLCGGNYMTALKTLGVVGVISDGPSRDVDECRPIGVQYMLTGVTAGHGKFSIKAINEPVNICGMDVSAGDVVHMDENGCVKFPSKYIGEVYDRAKKLQAFEAEKMSNMNASKDVEELIRAFGGKYNDKK